MKRPLLLVLLLVAACGLAGSSSAQRSSLSAARLMPEMVAPRLGTALDPRLTQVLLAVRTSGADAALERARLEGLLVAHGKVRVVVHARAGRVADARAVVRVTHGNVVHTRGKLIDGLVPPKALQQLATSRSVARVVPTLSAAGAETMALRAAAAQAPTSSETVGTTFAETASESSAPGAPTDVMAEAGDGQAIVNFTPPASDGGDAILYYTATAYPGGPSASGTGTTIVVGGLTNGESYVFTVSATNNVGAGVESDPSNPVTPDGPSRLDPDDPPPASRRPGVPTFSTASAPRQSLHHDPGEF
jgi:hypothetical protein